MMGFKQFKKRAVNVMIEVNPSLEGFEIVEEGLDYVQEFCTIPGTNEVIDPTEELREIETKLHNSVR